MQEISTAVEILTQKNGVSRWRPTMMHSLQDSPQFPRTHANIWIPDTEPGKMKLEVLLGSPFPRMSGKIWQTMLTEKEPYFDLPPIPKFRGLSAIDARVVAVLAEEFGDRFELEGDELYLVLKKEKLRDPFLCLFLNDGDTELRLS